MITNKLKLSKENKIMKSPLLAVLFHKTKTKNSILRLKSAGEPSQRASQQPLFLISGEGGIRTPDRVVSITVFETAAFNHSATSPELKVNLLLIIFNLYRNIYSVFVFRN